jgi:putative spermidine/putrescine transport system permease protein
MTGGPPAQQVSLSRIPASRSGRFGLGLFLAVAVAPVAFALGYAALYSVGAVGLLSEGLSLEPWARVLTEGEASGAFALSLYVAAATVALTVALALTLALTFRRQMGEGRALQTFLYAPLAIPAVVGAFLVFQLLTPSGLVARWLAAAGLLSSMEAFPRLVNDRWAVGVLVAHVGLAVPYFTLLFAEIYRAERLDEMAQLARTLGAGTRDVRWRLEVPVLLRRAGTNAALLFVAVFGSYEIPLLLGRQSPQMVSVLTLRKFERFNLADKPEAFVLALLYTAIVVVLLLALFRWGRVAAGSR